LKKAILCLCLLFLICNPVMAAEPLPVLEKKAVFTVNSDVVIIDSQPYAMDASPFIEKDRVFLPLRYMSEVVGATAEWQENEIVLNLPNKTIIFKENELLMNNNGQYEPISVAPVIADGQIYLPVRYVGEAAGYKVKWDPDAKTAIICKT